MAKKIKVIHYINQFYGGFGGEKTADMDIVVKDGPVGPGVILQKMLGDRAEIVTTIICGDNHISENLETVVPQVLKIIQEKGGEFVVCGPGFNAGRYGMACGAITAAVQEQLKLPCVTALYAENPGTDLYKDRCYILQTDNNAKNMKTALENIVKFSIKLMDKVPIADGKTEGYHGSGPAVIIDYSIPAPKRGIDMLLKKFSKKPFATEVKMPNHEDIPVPILQKPLSESKIALITDGGLVPLGNPDKMVPTNSKTFKSYSIDGLDELDAKDFEVSHQGYNNAFVLQDPNRLVPVDAMRNLVKKGKIGSLYDRYFTTAGVMTPMNVAKKFGEGIAQRLREANVDAAILTST